jgi:hypothetical protein
MKDSTTVGSIGTLSSRLHIENGDTGLRIAGDLDQIFPCGSGGGDRDAAIDLGSTGVRFKDLYLSNSVRLKGATRDISIQQDNYGLRVYDNDASSERFRIDASGNIGIGTSSPDKLVHLKTAVNNTAVLRIESTATDSYPFLSLKNDAREYQLTAHGPLGDVFTIYDGTSGNHRFVINSSGNVGIGTTSISSSDRLSINGGNARIVNSVAQSGNTLDNSTFSGLIVNNSNDANGDLAGIVMYPTSQYTAAAGVFGVRESQTAAGISFWSGSNTGSERMRIDSSGNLLVGTTSTIPFTLTSGTGAGITSAGTIMGGATAEAGLFNRVGGDGNIINFYRTGSIVGNIGAAGARLFINSGNVGLNFAGDGSNQILPSNAGVNRDDAITLGTTNVRFKDLYLSGGIYLGGTGSANYLDEYEEGSLSLSVATGTASFAYAKYTKVGNLVTIRFQMLTISDQSSSSNLLVTGLPFTSTAANQSTSGILSRYFNGGGDAYIAYISASSSQVQFFQTVNNGNYHQVRHVDLTNTNANAYVTISYETT